MPAPEYTSKDLERFWSKVAITSNPDECWTWVASLDRQGYGKFGHRYHTKITSRVCWEISYGEIPSGFFVCHNCDNRKCCNPKHLFLGTRRDNIDDMLQKGRNAKREYHGMRKLTEDQIAYIRQQYANGATPKNLANEVNVSAGQIRRIIHRENWPD